MAGQQISKNVGGRPKGTIGYFGRSARLILEQTFEGMGGIEEFIAWGKNNRTDFYKIWAKLLPTNIQVPSSLDAARVLLAQLEQELEEPPMDIHIEPLDAEIVSDGPDGTTGSNPPDSEAASS